MEKQAKSTPIIRGIINTKQKFGLGNNPNQIFISRITQTKKKLILKEEELLQNNIDHIWGIDFNYYNKNIPKQNKKL